MQTVRTGGGGTTQRRQVALVAQRASMIGRLLIAQSGQGELGGEYRPTVISTAAVGYAQTLVVDGGSK